MTDRHWPECWRYASHHACAVAEVERLRAELGELKARTGRVIDWMMVMMRMLDYPLETRLFEEEATGDKDWDMVETAARGALIKEKG